jgi:putative inorganic carbon (hco3(-)) transporter
MPSTKPNIRPALVLQTLALLCFVALITFLPSVQFMPKFIIWFNDRQRLLELLLLSLVLLDSIFSRLSINPVIKKDLLVVPKRLWNALFVLLLLACISAYLAQSPRHAIIEVSVFTGLCYLSLFVARLFLENKQKLTQQITVAIWASILLYMLSFYTGYITATIFKTPLQWPFPFTGFSNIRSFNQYQLWTLGLICLPLLAFDVKKSARVWLNIALIAWWVLLFYSASRGVLLAWLAGMLLTTVIYKKSAWLLLRLQLINVALGFCSYYLLFKVIPAAHESSLVTNTVVRQTTDDRIGLWQQAIILIRESPIFGVGPMHYAWFNTSNGHPHNSVLQLASEWGLPATLIILAIAGYGIYSWLKKFNVGKLQVANKLDSNLAILLFFTIIINAAYSLVDGVIVTPISQVLMFTTIGLMIGLYCNGQLSTDGDKTIKSNYQFRPFFAAIVLVVMVWSTLPELINGLSGNQKGFSMGYTAVGPRFWHETK